MVALGQANPNENESGDESDLCEVINMADSTSFCNNLPAYPLPIRLSTGQVVNSIPIIAGGDPFSTAVSSIYKFDKESNSWLSLGNMSVRRNQHSSAVLNNALWLIGGFDTDWPPLQSTELVYTNGTITSGPDLPTLRGRHCSVQSEDGKIFIIGGSDTNHKVTTIFDPETSTYTDGPDMLFGHENFGCAHFYSKNHGGRPVVLSAGDGYYGSSKAEVWDYSQEKGTWEESK